MFVSHLVIFISYSFQAKKFVESLPQNVKEKVSKEEADEMKKVLEAAGGTVEIEVWNIVQLTKFGIKIYIVLAPSPFLLILLKQTLFCPAIYSKGWFRSFNLVAWDKLTTTLQNECCKIYIIVV